MPSAINISALMASQSSWENWGYASTALVAICCFGEFVHECTIWFKEYPWWKDKGGRASALLLVAAIAGELITQVKANNLSGQLIAFLSLQTAQQKVALAKIGIARTLTPAQIADIGRKVSAFKGTRFDLGITVTDPEPFHFFPDIANALIAGGWEMRPWNVPTNSSITDFVPIKIGVFDWYAVTFFIDGDNVRNAAQAAADALTASGIDADVVPRENMPLQKGWVVNQPDTLPASIHVVIGTRPMHAPIETP